MALSASGDTVLVGGDYDNTNVGAAWVFTRSGERWAQQGHKLTGGGETGEGLLRQSACALSAEGDVALIGGRTDHGSLGAAWEFTRSGETWTQQGEKLTGGGRTAKGSSGTAWRCPRRRQHRADRRLRR